MYLWKVTSLLTIHRCDQFDYTTGTMKTVIAFALLTLCIFATQTTVSAVSQKVHSIKCSEKFSILLHLNSNPVPLYVNSEPIIGSHISLGAIATTNANPDIYSNLIVEAMNRLTLKHYNAHHPDDVLQAKILEQYHHENKM